MTCRKSVAAMIAVDEQGAFVQAVLDLKNTGPSIIAAAQAANNQTIYGRKVFRAEGAQALANRDDGRSRPENSALILPILQQLVPPGS